MHFKTLFLAGLTSLAAVASLPTSNGAHDSHIAARHHRFIRPRKPEPVSSKKRCSASTSTESATPEPTETTPEPTKAGNLASKPSTTVTRSAKFTTISTKSTKSGKATATASETETDTAADPEPTAPTSGTGGITIGDKLVALFPGGLKKGLSNWSTNPAASNALSLSDQTLRAFKSGSLSHPVVTQSGKKAMEISFAKGAVAYRGPPGGLNIYAQGPAAQPIDNAKVMTFSYAVMFQEGFDWNKGGKLPGLYGGTSMSEATGCSGGRTRNGCWSARFMWRQNGAGELYAYLPANAKATNKAAVCSGNPTCDEGYGWSLGRKTWTWKTGVWQTIAQKVTLNDVGKSNGEIVVYLDGKEVYSAKNIVIRTDKSAMARGTMLQTFFGGHEPEWASPKSQKLWFSDFSVAVLESD